MLPLLLATGLILTENGEVVGNRRTSYVYYKVYVSACVRLKAICLPCVH